MDEIDSTLTVRVRRASIGDRAEWLRLRLAVWPDSAEVHRRELAAYFAEPGGRWATFVVERPEGGLGGFLEVRLRGFAEGCVTSPVGYLEGMHLDPDYRDRSVIRALVLAAEEWARGVGCREMASACDIEDEHSYRMHRAFGYDEVDRIICFRKALVSEVPTGRLSRAGKRA